MHPHYISIYRDLEQAVADFVVYYNTQRYHESLDNVIPADIYFGRQEDVLSKRDIIQTQDPTGAAPSSSATDRSRFLVQENSLS
jgi:hypothetical protein